LSSTDTNYRKGLLLTGLGGLALTVDIPLIRLADGNAWSILMMRSGTTFAAALVIWAVWRALTPKAPKLIPGWKGLIVAMCYGVGSVSFTQAVFATSTANVVFMIALSSMFAALLSWIFLGERPVPATLIAMAAMVVGVLVIVQDSLGGGTLYGDLMALCSAVLIASAITISRSTGKDMGFAALVGVFFPFLLTLPMVGSIGYSVTEPWWIILDGAVMMPIAFFCLANGPKYISAPEVGMFYLLETVLAPIWVWLIFAEAPSRNSLIGGLILVTALVCHSLWQLTNGRRRRVAQPA
jgi:drug/metabolite transporter (DMT)-like permease